MQLGRARNCDLVLVPAEHDGVLRFSRPTSAAFRVAAYVEVLARRGVDVEVIEVDNPRRPVEAELAAHYDAADSRLLVPDIALDAGSHIPERAVLTAQFHVHAAVCAYLLAPSPAPEAVDLGALVPALQADARPHLASDFVLRYARKELRMTAPAADVDAVAGAGLSPAADAPASADWERALVDAAGAAALAAARRAVDNATDAVSGLLDPELESVLSALAEVYPALHEYGFYVPPDAEPPPAVPVPALVAAPGPRVPVASAALAPGPVSS